MEIAWLVVAYGVLECFFHIFIRCRRPSKRWGIDRYSRSHLWQGILQVTSEIKFGCLKGSRNLPQFCQAFYEYHRNAMMDQSNKTVVVFDEYRTALFLQQGHTDK
jgi:hypothetical protein